MLQMNSTSVYLSQIEKASQYILSNITKRDYTVGIICGSGLSIITNDMTDLEELSYSAIPGFSEATGNFSQILILLFHRSVWSYWYLKLWFIEWEMDNLHERTWLALQRSVTQGNLLVHTLLPFQGAKTIILGWCEFVWDWLTITVKV